MFKKYMFYALIISLCFSANTIQTNNFDIFKIKNLDEYTVEVTINIGEINLNSIEINNEEYTQILLNNSYPSKIIGTPNLPMLNKLIEIPREANIRIEIIEDEVSLYNLLDYNIDSYLEPTQEPLSKSNQNSNFIINQDVYNNNQFYKNNFIQVVDKGTLREVNIANLMISPIEYNPISNQLLCHNKIKFKIFFDNANIPLTNEKKINAYSPYFEPIFYNAIENYSSPSQTRENDFIQDVVSYIIIADESFSNSLEPFIDWKTKKGFHVTTAFTSDIGSSSLAIKNYLNNQYNNPENGMPIPTFVLLVGDTPQIPASYSSGGHVSDLDYCDYTNDNLPDVLCGRFSAQSAIHVSSQVNKTIEYEEFSMPDPSFLSDVLMISGVDSNYAPTYGNGQINYGNNYYFNSNNDINSITYLYPASGSSESQILNVANQGVGFINYTAHGWEDGFADPEFNVTDANNMINSSKYPTMVGNCCLTNAFDSGTCFGEALLRKSNGGAIGYIGGSDVTYWNEDYWWGVGSGNISSNPSYNNTGPGTYDAIFHEGNESNWAVVNSTIIMAGNLAVAQANGMDDYYWEIYHLMGDPSLSTYFGIPDNNNINHDVFLPIGSEAIEIQANPYSYVGLTQNGNLLAGGHVDENGFIVLVFNAISEPGTLELVITGQNTIPYFGEIFVASPDGPYTTVNSTLINSGFDNLISQGELIEVEVEIENVGSETASSIELTLLNTNSNEYVNLETSNVIISNLGVDEIVTENLSFFIDNNAPYGHNFDLTISMISENSTWESTYNLSVESLIEDFSSAAFDEFLWEFDGNMNWIIDGNPFIGDTYSAKSGQIDHNMTSELSITMDIVEDGYITFDKMVSCEDVGSQTGNFYDYLGFYIDNIEQSKWAGEISWSQNSFPVSSGEHTFTWKFVKDQAVTSGDDSAWIDNIVFPPSFYSSVLIGDVNNDGNINIQDVISTVNIILNSTSYIEAADINGDSSIDVIDVIGIVNLILG